MQKHATFSACLGRKQNRVGGFTLIELLVTVTVAAILAAAVAPSFGPFIASQRVKAASFDLVAALTQTRSEAIKRNANVSMTAAAGGWKDGWTIASGATTLAVKSAYKGLTIVDSGGAVAVTFRGDGRLATGSAEVNLTVDSPDNPSAAKRCISLSLSGRASSKVGVCP